MKKTYSDEEIRMAYSYTLYDKRPQEFHDNLSNFQIYCSHDRDVYGWFEPEDRDWFTTMYESPEYEGYIDRHSIYRSFRMAPKGVDYLLYCAGEQKEMKLLLYLFADMCFENDGYRVGQALIDYVDGKELDRRHLSFLKSRAAITSNGEGLTNLGLVLWDKLPDTMAESKLGLTTWDW